MPTYTKRQFIFWMFLACALLANALLANSWPMWVLFALIVLMIVFRLSADRSVIVAKLYEERGARTDVRFMTRQELLRSGRSFLTWGLLISLVVYVTVFLVMPTRPAVIPKTVEIIVGAFTFVAFIAVGMLLVGGVYMSIRGVFRRNKYDPSHVLAQDLLQRAAMEFYRFEGVITASHEPPDIPPAQFECDEQVRIEGRDEEWPDFLWCIHEDGRSSWIPEDYLYLQNNSATLLDEYSSVELRVFVLEHVRVLNSVGGWHWCKNRRGQFGWIPATKVQPAKP